MTNSGFKYGGLPITRCDTESGKKFTGTFLVEKLAKVRREVDLLECMGSVQQELYVLERGLLRQFGHRTSSLPRGIDQPFQFFPRRVQEITSSAFKNMIGESTLTPTQELQLTLPKQFEGFGLPVSPILANLDYVSSWASKHRYMVSVERFFMPDEDQISDDVLLSVNKLKRVCPPLSALLTNGLSKNFQKNAYTLIGEMLRDEFKMSISEQSQAVLASTGEGDVMPWAGPFTFEIESELAIVAAEIFWKFPEWKISGNFQPHFFIS